MAILVFYQQFKHVFSKHLAWICVANKYIVVCFHPSLNLETVYFQCTALVLHTVHEHVGTSILFLCRNVKLKFLSFFFQIYACMMVFFFSNMIENQLMSTGAFEITLNGESEHGLIH